MKVTLVLARPVTVIAGVRHVGVREDVPEYDVEAETVLRWRKAIAAFEASQKEMLARIKDVA